MQLDDQVSIRTPEGVDLQLTLAGLASRIAAALLDFVIQAAALIVLALFAATAFPDDLGMLGLGLVGAAVFLIFFGYPIIFETLDGGRSVGKRAAGLRVVRSDGGPVSFSTAAIRNIMRLVDFLPALYAVGGISILATAHHQRLGDLVASTLVIRERMPRPVPLPAPSTLANANITGGGSGGSGGSDAPWDVSRITAEELAVIRRYFERSPTLPATRRAELAVQMVTKLAPKVAAPPGTYEAEAFLARILAEKTARR